MTSRQTLDQGWSFRQADSRRWLPAQVPGCVHADLLRMEAIPDPFWGCNEEKLQWIEEKAWTYRCEFFVTDEVWSHDHIDLVAEGLDTAATLILNGHEVARTESMFIGYRFAIKEFLREKSNKLEILFQSPMSYIRAHARPGQLREGNDPVGGSSVMRKQPCSFGWDWGPRFATSGIYLPIHLEGWSRAKFRDVKIQQKHSKDSVTLRFHAKVDGGITQLAGTVSLGGRKVGEIQNGACRITNPKLWWPNGMGEQPLYEVQLVLQGLDGETLDVWTKRIGLRTVTLDRHPDKVGETFQFRVNGRLMFAKGANWIPAHSFVSEAGPELYRELLTSAVEANMNMIRVWGGGIYEKEIFYDLCDEKGLLVWQDFMFACALYPADASFVKLVRDEAIYQVRRLAHRACLALWCGNNEIERFYHEIVKTSKRKRDYERIFYKLLPDIVKKEDGVTDYWPCSSHNPEGYEKGFTNERAGDFHDWDVWHRRMPIKRYEERTFRFLSEFGMQSYASPRVAATFCPNEEVNVFSPEMENHQKNGAGNQIISEYLAQRYRFPKNYEALSYLSQLNQAYAMKVAIEHCRRAMPVCMGALYWQLNDCWPVASWSSVEFGGDWKALHHEARRFFSPALLSIFVPGRETTGIGNSRHSTIRNLHFYTVYDGVRDRMSATIHWSLEHFDGKVIRKGRKTTELCQGKSQQVLTLDLHSEMKKYGPENLFLHATLSNQSGVLSEQTVFLTAPRRLRLPKGRIKTKVIRVQRGLFEVEVESPVFQHAVWITVRGEKVHASDNFFDLLPGKKRKIRVKTSRPLNTSEMSEKISLFSLRDSY